MAKAHEKQDRCCFCIVWLSTQATACFVFLSHEKSKVDHFSHYQNIADYECCRNNFELKSSHPNKRRAKTPRFVSFIFEVLIPIIEHIFKLATLR